MMMKRNLIYAIPVIACFVAVGSCQKEELVATKAVMDLKVTAKVEEMNNPSTKVDLINSGTDITDKTLTLFGWEGSTYFVRAATATFDDDKWELSGSYQIKTENTYSFLSYANLPDDGATLTPTEEKDGAMTLTVTDITAAQEDILLGRGTKTFSAEGDAVEITYSHPYASVEFALGNAREISAVKSLSLSGVYAGGQTSYSLTSEGYTWNTSGYRANATLEKTEGLSDIAEGGVLATFVVIPQKLDAAEGGKSVMLTLVYDKVAGGEGSMVKVMETGEWKAGYTTSYSIFKNTGEVEVTPNDDATISNSGTSKVYVAATITGAWYDDSGRIIGAWSIDDGQFTGLASGNWERADDIFYCTVPLESGAVSPALFSQCTAPSGGVSGASLKIDILVQAITYDASKTCRQAFEVLSDK